VVNIPKNLHILLIFEIKDITLGQTPVTIGLVYVVFR
jgi:hypothetical protein